MDKNRIIINGSMLLLVVIVIIVIIIIKSYSKWNTSNFVDINLNSTDESNINTNKKYLNNILRLMKQKYPNVNTNLASYNLTDPTIDNSSPLKIDTTNLDAEYQISFIQELQNREIDNLEAWLNELNNRLPTPSQYNANTVKSVKHIPTGKLFGVLKNPNQLGPQISIIIDPRNATCVKHITPTSHSSTSGTLQSDTIQNIDLTACDYNPSAPGQKFILETVTNNSEFNNMLNPSQRDKYSVSENYGFGVYPFSVIKVATPGISAFDTHIESPSAECITLDNTGLSIEPCTGKESQRFTMTDIPVDLSS